MSRVVVADRAGGLERAGAESGFAPVVISASFTPAMARSDRLWWLLAALMFGVLLMPLLAVPIPPLLDYPNHLARMFVLAHPDDPFLSKVYVRHWAIIPNLGIDLVMPWMAAVMPATVAGRLMLAVVLLMPVIGTLAYSRAVMGRRTWWSLGAGFAAYNITFLMGFMSFQMGIGSALLAASVWVRWSDRRPLTTAAITAVLAVLIFFIHLIGILFLGLLIASHEAVAVWTIWRAGGALLSSVARRAAVAAAVFVVPFGLLLAAPLTHSDAPVLWGPLTDKLFELFGAFLNYTPLPAIGLALVLGAVVVICLTRGWARVAPEAVLAATILLALYPFAPKQQENAFLDIRVPVMAGFLLFAAFAPERLPRRVAGGIGAVLGAILVLRVCLLTETWIARYQDVTAFRAVIASVPPASRVLVTMTHPRSNPAWWHAMPEGRRALGMPTFMHLPGLLVVEHDSMWPLMFTDETSQPVSVRPAFKALTLKEGLVPDYHLLGRDTPSEDELSGAPYMANWPSKFDYVLVMGAGGASDLDRVRPDRLTLVARADIAAMFRINRP
jgi:hypothetical protein